MKKTSIISISNKLLSSFFHSFILSLSSFYSFLLFFPYLFRFNFVVSEQNVHYFLPTYLGGTFFPLLDVSERKFFQVGGACAPSAPPPAYAPDFCWLHVHVHCFFKKYYSLANTILWWLYMYKCNYSNCLLQIQCNILPSTIKVISNHVQ